MKRLDFVISIRTKSSMINQNKFTGLIRYTQKVFGLGALISEYDQGRPYKQVNDAKVMFGITSGLGAGCSSSTHCTLFAIILACLRKQSHPYRKFLQNICHRHARRIVSK